jgi:hypothetical protein
MEKAASSRCGLPGPSLVSEPRSAAVQPHKRLCVDTRRRGGPAAVQDIVIRMMKRIHTRLLDSRLREYWRCERERQSGCSDKELEFGHGLSSVNQWVATSRLLRP